MYELLNHSVVVYVNICFYSYKVKNDDNILLHVILKELCKCKQLLL